MIEEEDEIAKGSAEEAKTKEHRMTHLHNKHLCEVCLKAKAQRMPQKNKVVALEPYTAPREAPAKCGGQVTADRLIKDDGGKEDSGILADTVALAKVDRATHWIAVYPKATNKPPSTP